MGRWMDGSLFTPSLRFTSFGETEKSKQKILINTKMLSPLIKLTFFFG